MLSRFTENTKRDWRFLKEVNETRLLALIKEKDGISRVELAKEAKMSKTAVSEIINRLINSGLIKEEGKGESTSRGGKRPTKLFIDTVGGFVFGIQIKRTNSSISLADSMGKEISRSIIEYEANPKLNEVFELLKDTMDRMMHEQKREIEKLIGIGIGVPGMVDSKTGNLILAETLQGWADQTFADKFIEYFNAPVVVDNDINIQTWGEYLLGAGEHQNDMILVHIGDGIGAGIIENEVLVRGIMGGAGEIGYLSLKPYKSILKENIFYHPEQEYVGQLFTRSNTIEAFKRAYIKSENDVPATFEIKNLRTFFSQADLGDTVAQKVIDDMSIILAVLCSNLIIMLNSSMLVLSGSGFNYSQYFLQKLQEEIHEYIAVAPLQRSTKIVYGQLNSEAALKGAVSLALDILYKPFIRK
ncbi:MAG: ROK family transcriptional regulator [Candidatus Marinimicrobia bacterium]|nr:ROK family transcriptional regulator [Candidatus Neomarinimicrobiota bacterium]